MSKIQELKTQLSLYPEWIKEETDEIFDVDTEEDKNSETQKAASKTEKWVEVCMRKVFGDDVFIFKMSSQEHPDFFIFNKTIYESAILAYHKFTDSYKTYGPMSLSQLKSFYDKTGCKTLYVVAHSK